MLPGGGEGREEVRKHSQGWTEAKAEAKGGTGKAGVERGEAVAGLGCLGIEVRGGSVEAGSLKV